MTVKWKKRADGWYVGSGFATDPGLRAKYKLGEHYWYFGDDASPESHWNPDDLEDMGERHIDAQGYIEDYFGEPEEEVEIEEEYPVSPSPAFAALVSPRSKAKTKTPAKRKTRRKTKRKTKRKTGRKAASRVRQGKKIAKSLERDSRGRFKPQR